MLKSEIRYANIIIYNIEVSKNMNLPKRKDTRLKAYNYSTPGAYFVTICTENRKPILSEIRVGTGSLTDSVPSVTS